MYEENKFAMSTFKHINYFDVGVRDLKVETKRDISNMVASTFLLFLK